MTRRGIRYSSCNTRRCMLGIAVALSTAPLLAWAQDAGNPVPFMLGTIVVVGKRIHVGGVGDDQVASTLSREQMREFNRDNIGDALNLLSGVTMSTNSRNEKTISVRGFDSRQVPLFIDGIPLYVPYDGYVDFNRFTTADLAAIQIAKGFSSVAYGANTLGGAINLVSRKPRAQFEGDISTGFASADSRQVAANAGTNQGLWYLQAGASWSQSDGFELSSDFKPTLTENGNRRNNADSEDRKVSLKLGLTPNDSDEYALSYYRQDGEKGQPPSIDPARARYWKWPYWDKESLYFLSQTALTDMEQIKLRLYLDTFDNEVHSYTDDTYTTLKANGPGSVGTGRSIYNDETSGGSVELESARLDAHTLRLVAHYRVDQHKELDAFGTLNTRFEDELLSFAAEDNIQIDPRWSLSLGVARHELRPDSVFSLGNPYSLPDTQTANDAQAGLFFDWSGNARFYTTIARKSRLPTLKDRYSQRLATYIENPDLQPEEALNYEIGYQGTPWAGATAEAAIFYSDIKDKIQSVANVSGILAQMQNVGEVRSTGMELGLNNEFTGRLAAGANYTWIDLDNRSDPSRKLTDAPAHKLTAQVLMHPGINWDLIAFAEYNSARWASDTVELDGFTTLNLKAAFKPSDGTVLEAGVSNVTDKDYELSEGFPSPGRTWFVRADYVF